MTLALPGNSLGTAIHLLANQLKQIFTKVQFNQSPLQVFVSDLPQLSPVLTASIAADGKFPSRGIIARHKGFLRAGHWGIRAREGGLLCRGDYWHISSTYCHVKNNAHRTEDS